MLKKLFVAALALTLCTSAGVRTASANLDLDELAAILAAPYIIDEGVETHLVVTNGLAEAVTLYVHVLDDEWNGQSFSCPVTARETTHFKFTSDDGYRVKFECSASGADSSSTEDELNIRRSEALDDSFGLVHISVEQAGATVSKNAIFGDVTVVDADSGLAYSFGALSIQGLDPLNQDGNKQYRYDGLEYAQFASAMATNFLAPDGDTDAEMICYTLDGTVDEDDTVEMEMKVLFYNDDELERDQRHDIDCLEIVDFEDIDSRLNRSDLGSRAGHMTLEFSLVEAGPVHEATGTGRDEVRNRPGHCILVQTFYTEGGTAAGARNFVLSTTAHTPEIGDVVNFNNEF